MSFDVIVCAFIILAMVCFFALSLRKAWLFAKMQIHARLDLYPMPREGNGRAEYGGSYYEEEKWWTKERKIDDIHEAIDILKEMLFIKKLFVHQRGHWYASYTMHLGIYLMFGWSLFLLVSIFWHPSAFVVITNILGCIAFTVAIVGVLMVIFRRVSDRVLAKYTTPLEYFNVFLLLIVLLTGAYCWLFVTTPMEVGSQVLTLSAGDLPAIVVVHLILLGVMFIYIPLSKMSHYVGKFFAYHKVLWDNDPNLEGSAVEKRFHDAAAHPATVAWATAAPAVSSEEKVEG